jgi:hypothetical protein
MLLFFCHCVQLRVQLRNGNEIKPFFLFYKVFLRQLKAFQNQRTPPWQASYLFFVLEDFYVCFTLGFSVA